MVLQRGARPREGPGLDTVNLLHMQQATNITDLSMPSAQGADLGQLCRPLIVGVEANDKLQFRCG